MQKSVQNHDWFANIMSDTLTVDIPVFSVADSGEFQAALIWKVGMCYIEYIFVGEREGVPEEGGSDVHIVGTLAKGVSALDFMH